MRIVCSLACVLLLLFPLPAGGSGGEEAAPSPSSGYQGCEPTGLVDLGARVVSMERHGDRVTATVQVDLASHVPLDAARLRGRDERTGVPVRDLGLDDRLGAVAARAPRARLYRLDLDGASLHHLYFTLNAEAGGSDVETTAHLLLDLDPSRQPVRVDDVLQYRARMEGR